MSPYLKVIPKVWRSWIDPLNRDLKNFFKMDMFEKNVRFFATILQKRIPVTGQWIAEILIFYDYFLCYDLIVCHSKIGIVTLTVLCMMLCFFLMILFAEETAVAFWHYEDTNLARYVYSPSHTTNRRPMQNSSAASLNSI